MDLLGVNAYELTRRHRFGDRLSVCAQAFDVEFNGFVDKRFHFFARLTNCNATGQIRHIRTVARWSVFDDNKVLHLSISLFQARLLEDVAQCSGRHVHARLSGHREQWVRRHASPLGTP